jgi:hypothetical protein
MTQTSIQPPRPAVQAEKPQKRIAKPPVREVDRARGNVAKHALAGSED